MPQTQRTAKQLVARLENALASHGLTLEPAPGDWRQQRWHSPPPGDPRADLIKFLGGQDAWRKWAESSGESWRNCHATEGWIADALRRSRFSAWAGDPRTMVVGQDFICSWMPEWTRAIQAEGSAGSDVGRCPDYGDDPEAWVATKTCTLLDGYFGPGGLYPDCRDPRLMAAYHAKCGEVQSPTPDPPPADGQPAEDPPPPVPVHPPPGAAVGDALRGEVNLLRADIQAVRARLDRLDELVAGLP